MSTGIDEIKIGAGDADVLTAANALAEAERFIARIPNYPGGFAGRGIVIAGGGIEHYSRAWVAINMLRRSGCALPIELWHLGPDELDDRMAALVQDLGVDCADALCVREDHPVRRLGGWELKPYAILHSRFEEVLLLDADNIVLRDPTFLFDCADYLQCGAAFWPDICRLAEDRAIWSYCGVPYRDEPEFDGGSILVDKKRCWRPLNLTMWYNEHSDFFYEHIFGDKETFHMAWRKLDAPYAMTATPPRRRRHVSIQYDFEGNAIFQHGVKIDYLGARGPGDIMLARECWDFVRQLRGEWDGGINGKPPSRPFPPTPAHEAPIVNARSLSGIDSLFACPYQARVFSHDQGDFRSVSDSNVLIYWPHGLGDWVFLSYTLRFWDQSNTYWITRFGDDSTALFDGCELVSPLYLGINSPHCDNGGHYGIREFGLGYSGLDGSLQQLQLPASLRDACVRHKIDTVFWSSFPEAHGGMPFPIHTKGRNLMPKVVGLDRRDEVLKALEAPQRSCINFNVAPWVRQWVEARMMNFGALVGKRLCVITRNGYTGTSKNWAHMWRDDVPGQRLSEGQECRDFMRVLLQKDPGWMFLVMEDQLFEGEDTVRSAAVYCVSYAEVFGAVGTSSIPFALILKALLSLADLAVGVPAGPYHLGMAKGDLPTVGVWLDHMPSWYDEPNDASIHLLSKNIVDKELHTRQGSVLTRENFSFRHEWMDTRIVSGENVLHAVEELLY